MRYWQIFIFSVTNQTIIQFSQIYNFQIFVLYSKAYFIFPSISVLDSLFINTTWFYLHRLYEKKPKYLYKDWIQPLYLHSFHSRTFESYTSRKYICFDYLCMVHRFSCYMLYEFLFVIKQKKILNICSINYIHKS